MKSEFFKKIITLSLCFSIILGNYTPHRLNEIERSDRAPSVPQIQNINRSLWDELEDAAKEDPKTLPHSPAGSEFEDSADSEDNCLSCTTESECDESADSEDDCLSCSTEDSAAITPVTKTLVPGPWRSTLRLAGTIGHHEYDHSFDTFHDELRAEVDRCLKKRPPLEKKNVASFGISFITKTGDTFSTESKRCDHPTDGAYVFISGAKNTKHKKSIAKLDTDNCNVALRNQSSRTPAKPIDGRSSTELQRDRVKKLWRQHNETTDSPQSVLSKEAMATVHGILHQKYFGIDGQFPEFFLSHTEQIIMQFFDDYLEEKIKHFQEEIDLYNEGRKIKKKLVGVYINIHSYGAVCKSCRGTLIRAIESPTKGFGKVLAELKKNNPNFKTGMLISSTIDHQGAHSTDHDGRYNTATTMEELESLKFIQKTSKVIPNKYTDSVKSSLFHPKEKKILLQGKSSCK